MDALKDRLDIFTLRKMITEDERKILEQWIAIINDYPLECEQEKLERMITHCAVMMKRQRDGESIGKLSEEIYEPVINHELYIDCAYVFKRMNEIYNINNEEEKYIILHLCNCFSKE